METESKSKAPSQPVDSLEKSKSQNIQPNNETLRQLLTELGVSDTSRENLDLNQVDLIALVKKFKEQQNTEKESVLNTVKNNAVSQLRQFGASTLASIIAILIAVISPIILNSQFVQDFKQTVNDIRNQLPNEADALLMNQVTELSRTNQGLINNLYSQQLLLKEKSSEYQKETLLFRQEYQNLNQKITELSTRNLDLVDNSNEIKVLRKDLLALQKKLDTGSQGPNTALYRQLIKLTQEGEALTAQKTKASETWFKKIFYTVQGLQKESTNQQLESHVTILKSIAEKSDGYKTFNQRREEALIILSALSSLADAAIIR